MSRLSNDVCHIEDGGFAFGKAADPLVTASRAIIIRDCNAIKIKFDNRGPAAVRSRSKNGGFLVGGKIDAKSTGRVGEYYHYEVKNGWICVDLSEAVR